MWTLAELSRLGVASIGDELVSPAARARLENLCAWGPRAAHFAAFECRLDELDADVDVSFALEGRGARAAVRHWLRANHEPHAVYAPCDALLRAWAADDGALSALGSVWIEVDLRGARPELPFVYFRPDRAGRFFQSEDAARTSALLAAWASANGAVLQPETAERLGACIAALPEGARVLLIAPQLHARAAAIRLSFRVSADRLLPYLARIGWPGARDALAEQLERCGAAHWAMPIQIDVVDGQLAPNISLEFTQSRENDYAERCDALLAMWRTRGVCSARKAQAVYDWRYGAAAHGDEPLSVQKLLDLKLTIGADGQLRSKAYLGTLGVNRYFTQAARESQVRSPAPSAAD
jgi:hypothetical protein